MKALLLCKLWLHQSLSCIEAVCDLTDMAKREHGVFLRPWHLSFHQDAGFRGYADPALGLKLNIIQSDLMSNALTHTQ